MADPKKYYWIKLKDSFMTSDAVDFLMSQKNGAEYVVLYQMLCLKTVNTDGRLERQIGEVIIKYDHEKIQRDTKYFEIDTIIIALELYKKLGLVYQDEDGTLRITDFERLVGSETDWAEKKRLYRENKGQEQRQIEDNVQDNVRDYFRQEKEIRERDKILDKDIINKKESKPVDTRTYNFIIDSYTADLTLKNNLLEFVKMRNKKRNSPTNHALDLLLKELDKLSNGDLSLKNKIVEKSTMRGWLGFFAADTNEVPQKKRMPVKDNELSIEEKAKGYTLRDGKKFDRWGCLIC